MSVSYTWKLDERKGKITGATLQLPWIIIMVHRHIHYEPDQWLMSCVQYGFSCHELKAKELSEACKEALQVVRDRSTEYALALASKVIVPQMPTGNGFQ